MFRVCGLQSIDSSETLPAAEGCTDGETAGPTHPATIAGSAAFVALTLVFHRVFFAEQGRAFAEHLDADTPLAMIAVVLYAATLTYLYTMVYRGGSPALEGYRLGACSGLIVIPTFNVIMINIGTPPWFVALDFLWHVLVQQALTGMIVGLVVGRTASASSH